MSRGEPIRSREAVAIVSWCFVAVPAFSQAWLPPKDTMTLSLAYQYSLVKKHSEFQPPQDRGHITAHSAIAQFGYSLTDRFEISAAVPYIAARYKGTHAHISLAGPALADNGQFHSGWQDYRVEARYQAVRRAVALTPFVGFVAPTHNYTYLAHAALGRDLHETSAGVYIGVTDLFSHFRGCGCPTASYLESRLAYSTVERVLGVRHDHVNGDIELGYFMTDRFSVRAFGSYNRTIRGIQPDLAHWPNPNDPYYVHHDQILAERHLNAGIGGTYAFSDRVDAFVSLQHTAYSRNGHMLHVALIAGTGWSFAPHEHASR